MENTQNNKRKNIFTIVLIAVCASITAVLAQTAIPFIGGVPVTLQTLAVALSGFFLGKKNGAVSVIVYILLGITGIPVFSGFRGGLGVLLGNTGGFIFGFIGLAFFCGFAGEIKNIQLKIILSAAGLAVCHILGTIQFAYVFKTSITSAFMMVSVPYIIKDILSIFIAYYLSIVIKKALKSQ